jgi:hypothetical protein
MADATIAKCDGGRFDPSLGYMKEPAAECPATLEVLPDLNDTNQKLHFQSNGWIRREFRGGYETHAETVWWSFCPDHVRAAVEQYYLARFSDDGE